MPKSLKNELISGTLWSIGGQLSSLAISLLANIYLARQLSPEEFGQMGIVMFFIVISNVFSEGGLAGAIIRKEKVTKIDYSTVFVFNIFVSFLCFCIIYLISESIGKFYSDPVIKNLLVFASIILIVNAFHITQNASLVRSMRFKQKSLYNFIAVFFSSIVGVILAKTGYGVWSLVTMHVLTSVITTVLLISFEGFLPRLRFSFDSFSSLYSFGVNTTLASLLNTAFDNIYQLILGKYFSILQVGLFFQAKKIQDVPGNIISRVLQSVIFSSMSKLQDDKNKFIKEYKTIMVFFSVILGIITLLFFLYAKNILSLLLGEKWLGATLFLKFLTVASFFYFHEMLNRVIFKVFNKTRKILVLEVVKKIILSLTIVLGIIKTDINVLMLGLVFSNVISYLLNTYQSNKIIGGLFRIELFFIIKIIFVISFIISLCEIIFNFNKIEGLEAFYFLPLIFILYFFSLKVFNVFDIILYLRRVKMYKKTIRK
ncbi:Membrane protein involved in the export of O-antigen and teichoic acid [Belliella buryatensis]|uniref:Membrane protein involved in the export of O-antigen and teichoic acid n=1 Tax=Belliella buryatensis TaxID=1500549 RepID=A0A239CTU6_9BACT|nr:lipopolysaccharide biosynthesis protein [Belliella buryatensis]SNS23272.1 Membrane protein involved in the export of O-antigen and teichoic acid [Belliella buryatensis]